VAEGAKRRKSGYVPRLPGRDDGQILLLPRLLAKMRPAVDEHDEAIKEGRDAGGHRPQRPAAVLPRAELGLVQDRSPR
jgi:hypothetical protein